MGSVIHTSVMGELKSSFFIIVWMFIEVSSGNMSKKIQLSDNSCCEQIRLGNATYVFSHIENETSRFHCVSKCVYSNLLVQPHWIPSLAWTSFLSLIQKKKMKNKIQEQTKMKMLSCS